jgi:gingipain R
MKTLRIFSFIKSLLLIAILFTSFTLAQLNNSNKGIQVNVISTSDNSTTLEFILNYYEDHPVNIDGQEYIFYDVPGSIWLMEKGMPQLPTHRTSIIIPDDAGMNFRILRQEYTEIETNPVMPSKGHLTRNIDPLTVPYTFDSFYQINDWYPQSNFTLDDPYIVRDLRGLTVQFNPMQYNPVEGKIKICNKLVVEVYSDPNSVVINPFVRLNSLSGVDKEFEDIYKSLFVNYGLGCYDYNPLPESGRLLIIYPSSFAANITPFYQWKQQKGISTILAEYPSQTGSGSAAIKNYIQNLYNSPDGLTFIILIGEASQIPTLYGTYESAPSDPSFVKLAGTDAYPDAFISRISPTSSANLDYILYKLIKYEKYPESGPNGLWYLKGTGVASDEGNPPDYVRANWLRDMLINNMNFTTVDQIYDPGATITQVTNALNNGRSILNYIGHGSGTSWGTTGFGNSNVYQLSNGYMNPFIIDVSCLNGDFTSSECLEEAWLRAGDLNNPKGAISAFGSSTLASWVPPCDMQNHAVQLLTTKTMKTVGGVCFNGIMHAMDLWGGSSGEGLKLMEQYNIMGDCTMMLTFGMIPDSTAPTQITDLSAVNPTSSSITLNWTSPYDSSLGGVTSYDLRYSTNPIITNQDFENAASVLIPGNPDTSGILKSYELKNLNFSTNYYFAIKAMDIWGNKSEMSNTDWETTWGAPQISVSPDSMHCLLLPNVVHVDSVLISNITAGNSTLDYTIELLNNTFPGSLSVKLNDISENRSVKGTRINPHEEQGTSFRGSGGPDLFGYEWIDSNDPQGPDYIWNDISTTGVLVTNWVPTSGYPAVDEGKAGPFNLGFNFKFYGIPYSQVYFSSNGFISFADFNDAGMTNGTIPSSDIPNLIIAPLWDDLDGKTNGKVYYKSDTDKFTVQYTNWPGYYSGTGPFTFQVVLYKNGKIIIYYNTVQGTTTSATVGIENQNGSDGLQVVKNAAYLQSNLALQFSFAPDWLTLNNFQGTIYNGNTIAVILNMLTQGLELGEYSMDLKITSNDPLNAELIIPIHMTVSNEIPVELVSFKAENNGGNVLLSWITATETNNKGFEVQRKSDIGKKQDWVAIAFVQGNGSTSEYSNYSFTDKIDRHGSYSYRLRQVDFDGTSILTNEVHIEVDAPKEFSLLQNYPNPFNPFTRIRYSIPVQSEVKITLSNLLGEETAVIVNKIQDAGYYEIEWNGADYASGVYLYKLSAKSTDGKKEYYFTRKMVLIK